MCTLYFVCLPQNTSSNMRKNVVVEIDDFKLETQDEELARYLYKSIVTEQEYVHKSFNVAKGGVVLDIGANIGITALFFARRYQCEVYAYEPSPPSFACLQANVKLNAKDGDGVIHAFATAVTEKPIEELTLVHYPNRSGLSTIKQLKGEQEERWYEGLSTLAKERKANKSSVEFFKRATLEREEYTVRGVTLADEIRRNGIKRVTLLKIDVERAEMDVLKSVDDDQWPLIDHVAVEVEQKEEMLDEVVKLLESKGYETFAESEEKWFGAVYARRKTDQ